MYINLRACESEYQKIAHYRSHINSLCHFTHNLQSHIRLIALFPPQGNTYTSPHRQRFSHTNTESVLCTVFAHIVNICVSDPPSCKIMRGCVCRIRNLHFGVCDGPAENISFFIFPYYFVTVFFVTVCMLECRYEFFIPTIRAHVLCFAWNPNLLISSNHENPFFYSQFTI